MPTPVAHSLIGVAIGLGAAWPRRVPFRKIGQELYRRRILLFAALVLANVPDLDYVPGLISGDLNAYHHVYTHSLGWITLVAAGLGCCARAWWPGVGWNGFFFPWVCMSSHLAADLFTDDGRPPFGIMLFWPISSRHFLAPFWVFPRVHKGTLGELFDLHNAKVMLYEAALILPVLVLVLLYKQYRAGPERGPSPGRLV